MARPIRPARQTRPRGDITAADSKLLEFNGITLTLREWMRRTGIDEETIDKRIQRGWSLEKALTTPARRYKRRK